MEAIIRTTDFLVGILINLVLIIGVMSIMGYIIDIPYLYRWGETAMAPNTAIAFILIGIILFIFNNDTQIYNGKQ